MGGRSKLAEQAAAQDKAFREYANNEVRRITADTAAKFANVRAQMAKDRAHADAEITHAAARMDASLNAASALQDKHFAQTVSDIKAAKAEAAERVKKFTVGFETDILALTNLAEEQNKKLNNRVTELGSVVQSNKLEQAKVNHEVDAELKRMLKLGDKRYQEHLDKDSELKAQMKKDRAHAENRLASTTETLYDTLKKNQEAQ